MSGIDWGAVVAFGIFVAGVIFKLGQHSQKIKSLEEWRTAMNDFAGYSARLLALETWRGNVRNDLHEISDKLEDISGGLSSLKTLVEERTERRRTDRTT